MTEEAAAARVGELMATLDEVKRYRELAYAMVDFAGIITVSLIAVVGLLFVENVYAVVSAPASGSGLFSTTSVLGVLSILFALLFGIVAGVYWVNARVKRTKVGEWRATLQEGAPGAVKLLSETDWDATLRIVNLSRLAYLFYALIKVAAYSVLVFFVLFLAGELTGAWSILQTSPVYLWAISVTVVLFFSWRGLAVGFGKMQSLDSLYWDLRVFSTEFKRAEFNKA